MSTLALELVSNPDIAARLGQLRRDGQVLVGFAAETDNLIDNALSKMRSKGLDAIVANDVTRQGCGFGSDTNQVSMVDRRGRRMDFQGTKEEVAHFVLDVVTELLEE
jgi:phosphopantothenoylcysteine decarboxylase/phosphopantothenate--cysteine ligase